ncbi:MAG: 4-hydroxy-tetrahydrodipicolinate reductase [Hyphomonadaceae bacterium]|jgi:4-hydroxy-tetrahydrodipicolinate reductase|nr:4-hydroxy-tetrahydrodipicolinate reductase [Hyphomonadaceae bacterium]
MAEALKIAIAGGAGRMGRTMIRLVQEADDLTLTGASEALDSPHFGAPVASLIPGAPASFGDVGTAANRADIWIDFTTPAATLAALDALDSLPVRAVIIGTTGFDAQGEAAIERAAAKFAIVRSGNFSLGVNLLTLLVEKAAAHLGTDWDIEISEAHHRRKVDAPSGTALMLGEAAATGRGVALADLRLPPHDGITGPRTHSGIGFSVTRAGGIIGDHSVLLAHDDEMITLSHRATDRSLFARGALHAARWAAGQPPGLYAMRDVLALT